MRLFSLLILVGIAIGSNYSPIPTIPSGNINCIIGESYIYSTQSIDFEGDQLQYEFDWNDGTRDVTGFYQSGKISYIEHSWKSIGTYWIRVRAIDSRGLKSDWSGSRAIFVTL